MLKKTITFEDLDGKPITEDFYFNVNKAEIAEMEMSHKGGLSDHLKRIIEAEDGAEIMRTFKDIISLAVGYRSEDGRRFVKSEEIRNEFMQTDAYSVLFMELVTDADAGANFIRGIMPADLAAQVLDQGETVVPLPVDSTDKDIPAWIREDREPTERELTLMDKTQMQEAFRLRAERQKREGSSQ